MADDLGADGGVFGDEGEVGEVKSKGHAAADQGFVFHGFAGLPDPGGNHGGKGGGGGIQLADTGVAVAGLWLWICLCSLCLLLFQSFSFFEQKVAKEAKSFSGVAAMKVLLQVFSTYRACRFICEEENSTTDITDLH